MCKFGFYEMSDEEKEEMEKRISDNPDNALILRKGIDGKVYPAKKGEQTA